MDTPCRAAPETTQKKAQPNKTERVFVKLETST